MTDTIQTIDVPGAPYGVTIASDGTIWFSMATTGAIGRCRDGVVDTFGLDPADGQPTIIIEGPDAAMWFTEFRGNRIGRITADGERTSIDADAPYGLCVGPDKALWFTELQSGHIARLGADGEIARFPVQGMPSMIVAGPDGALWFTLNQANAIGRCTTAGEITVYPLPTEAANPVGITAGPDHALWFVEIGAGQIGRISTDGAIEEFALADRAARPHAITTGPDQALWFTEWGSGGWAGSPRTARSAAWTCLAPNRMGWSPDRTESSRWQWNRAVWRGCRSAFRNDGRPGGWQGVRAAAAANRPARQSRPYVRSGRCPGVDRDRSGRGGHRRVNRYVVVRACTIAVPKLMSLDVGTRV